MKIKKSSKVIAIVGPTGSGKTVFAKKIAAKFRAKIISADSRQVYQGLDIGTGKDKSFRQELIDLVKPTERFTLWDWQKMAERLISEYLNANSLPVLVGGTGLYIDAVLYGYVIPNVKGQSLKLRKKLEGLKTEELYEKLKVLDPLTALKIDSQNKRRLVRALEVAMLGGESFVKIKKKKKPPYKVLIIGIKTDRQTLYSKIDARIDRMIKNGLIEEVRQLLKKYKADLPALNTIGYKEIIDYLQGGLELKEAITKIKTNTHDYVRRQETWFRRNKDIKWVTSYEEAEKLTSKFLKSK